MSLLIVRALHGQGIETRYHGPTNFRGSRIAARCDAKHMFVPYDHAVGVTENHEAACKALCSALGWDGHWIGASTARGYVFARYEPIPSLTDLAKVRA